MFRLVLRLVASTAGRAAALRAAPLYGAMFVLAGLVFGGNGMHPRTLADTLGQPLGLVFLAAWTAITWPVAEPILAAPHELARAWPIPRRIWAAVNGTLLVLVELPWLILFLFGRPSLAVPALFLAVSAHAALALRHPLAVLAVAGAAWFPLAGVVLAPALLVLAWERAIEPRAQRTLLPVPRRPLLALVVSFALALARRRAVELGRALGFLAVCTALTALITHNRGSGHDGALVGAVPALVGLAAALAAPLVDGERAAAELWLGLGVPARRRAAALVLLVAAIFAPLAAAHAALVAHLAGAPPLLPALLAAPAGAALAGFGAACALYQRDAPRLLGAVAAATVAVALAGIPGALLPGLTAVVLLLRLPDDDEAAVLG